MYVRQHKKDLNLFRFRGWQILGGGIQGAHAPHPWTEPLCQHFSILQLISQFTFFYLQFFIAGAPLPSFRIFHRDYEIKPCQLGSSKQKNKYNNSNALVIVICFLCSRGYNAQYMRHFQKEKVWGKLLFVILSISFIKVNFHSFNVIWEYFD